MEFAEILKNLRQQRGITQKELAAYLHCSVGTVSNYENGIHQPSLQILCQIANFYEVTVDYLLGRTDCPHDVSALKQELGKGYSIKKFLDLMKKLPDNDQRYLLYGIRLLERSHKSPALH